MTRPLLFPLRVVVPVLVAVLIACSGGDSSPEIDIEVVLTSQDSILYQAGSEKQSVYGWNRLTGTAEVGGEEAQVELLGSVDYLEGSGEFFGFVTVSFADGSSFGVRITDGRTEAATDTSNATFQSGLEIIDGSGRYAGASGDGEFEGV